MKYQSIFRGTNAASKQTDVWDKKDASDFLYFLRVEFQEFARHGGFLIVDTSMLVIFVRSGMTDDLTKNVYRWVFLSILAVNRFVFASRLLITLTFKDYQESSCMKMTIWILRAVFYVIAVTIIFLSWTWLNQFQRMWGIAELIAIGLEMPNEILLMGQVAEL